MTKNPVTLTMAALLVILAGFWLGCSQPGEEPEASPPKDVPKADLKALAEGNNAFAIDLYKKLAAEGDGNIVLSPYSIRTALAMAYAGARGETAEEMAKVLHFTLPDDKLHAAFTADKYRLTKSAGSGTLDMANALWPQSGLKLAEPFVELTERHYGTVVRPINTSDTEAARQQINRWTAEKTRGKIPELLPQGVLTPDSILTITNAVYLNCGWVTRFPKSDTHEKEFESKPGESVKVPMMQVLNADFRYMKGPDFTMLELPYEGEKLAMWVLLPNERGRLSEVEANLSPKTLTNAANGLSKTYASEVALPRFTSRRSFDLNGPLQALGIRRAFESADFSGMIPDGNVNISAVQHEAYVQVDERGTEAAAATEPVFKSERVGFRFRADQPFLFLITEPATGTILFLGRVVSPVEPS